MAGQYRRPRVSFGIDEEIKNKIEAWAECEHRTLANLIEHMVIESYKRRLNDEKLPVHKDVIDDDKEDLARFVRKLAQGTMPSDQDCIFAAHEAGIDSDLALKLRDQIFYKPKNGINNH